MEKLVRNLCSVFRIKSYSGCMDIYVCCPPATGFTFILCVSACPDLYVCIDISKFYQVSSISV